MPRESDKLFVDNLVDEVHQKRNYETYLRGIIDDDSDLSLGLSETTLFELDDIAFDLSRDHIQSRRYLERNYRDRSFKFDLEDCISHDSRLYNQNEFLEDFRMSRLSFHVICDTIRGNSVFRNKATGRKQKKVELQLLVFLYRLGRKGADASYVKISNYFGIGAGTAAKFCKRVQTALLSLEKEVVKWPSEEEKASMKSRIKILYGFQNCIGLIDGTLIELDKKPSKYGDGYFSRKSSYGINVQIICDDKRNITYYYGGWPGSTHDNRAWNNCHACINPDKYFGPNEYLIGDSAYSISQIVIQPFKKPRGKYKVWFNETIARVRVRSEHFIGILKNRFPCLKLLNIDVGEKRGMKDALSILGCCIVLHNLLLVSADDDIQEEWLKEIEDKHKWRSEDDSEENEIYQNASKDERRQRVFESMVENYNPEFRGEYN